MNWSPPGRCAQCWERLLWQPAGRVLCAACLKQRGETLPISYGTYRPRSGRTCPECPAVLDEGTTIHPDCADRIVRGEAEREAALVKAQTKRQRGRA